MNSKMRFCPQCGSDLIAVQIDGRERLECSNEACDYVFWNNPTPVVAAVVEVDGKIVLTQSKGWSEKWYGIVAGFLEEGETPEEGILREISEELDLKGKITAFIGHYKFPERNQLIIAYHVTAEGEIHMGGELQRIKLISPEEVHPWKKGTGPALQDWLAGRIQEKSSL